MYVNLCNMPKEVIHIILSHLDNMSLFNYLVALNGYKLNHNSLIYEKDDGIEIIQRIFSYNGHACFNFDYLSRQTMMNMIF